MWVILRPGGAGWKGSVLSTCHQATCMPWVPCKHPQLHDARLYGLTIVLFSMQVAALQPLGAKQPLKSKLLWGEYEVSMVWHDVAISQPSTRASEWVFDAIPTSGINKASQHSWQWIGAHVSAHTVIHPSPHPTTALHTMELVPIIQPHLHPHLHLIPTSPRLPRAAHGPALSDMHVTSAHTMHSCTGAPTHSLRCCHAVRPRLCTAPSPVLCLARRSWRSQTSRPTPPLSRPWACLPARSSRLAR